MVTVLNTVVTIVIVTNTSIIAIIISSVAKTVDYYYCFCYFHIYYYSYYNILIVFLQFTQEIKDLFISKLKGALTEKYCLCDEACKFSAL